MYGQSQVDVGFPAELSQASSDAGERSHACWGRGGASMKEPGALGTSQVLSHLILQNFPGMKYSYLPLTDEDNRLEQFNSLPGKAVAMWEASTDLGFNPALPLTDHVTSGTLVKFTALSFLFISKMGQWWYLPGAEPAGWPLL